MSYNLQKHNTIFFNFVSKYDLSNESLQRKVIHSFSVAEHCYTIASKLNLSNKNKQFAYLVGLYHDLGRFEQMTVFGTFDDNKSVDHGDLSAKFIDTLGLDLDKKDIELLKTSVKNHTKLDNGKTKTERLFTKIIKNADAFANIIMVANGTHQIRPKQNGVTEGFVEKFINLKPLYRLSCNTKLDVALRFSSFCYNLKYDFLIKYLIDYNILDSIYSSLSIYLNAKDKKLYKNLMENMKKTLKQKVA